MASIESAHFNPQILKSLRGQLGYTAEDVARLSGLGETRYLGLEQGEVEPKSTDLKKLAKFFRIQEFGFFRRSAPTKSREINFRAGMPTYKGEPGPILDAIEFATGVQALLATVADTGGLWRERRRRKLSLSSDAEKEAGHWRNELELSDEVQLAIDTPDQFFTLLRSRIEDKGVSVLVYSFEEKSFKGLVFGSSNEFPVILINSYRQRKASRTFTLAHEFGHVLLDEDGVSNPYEPVTRAERFCNKFAAALLMPRNIILRLAATRRHSLTSNSTIKWLSNKLKVSMEAVVIRLIECGLAESSFWSKWKSQFERFLPSEEAVSGGGGSEEGVDPGLVKLAYFGFLFGKLVPDRFDKSGLTGMAMYKASRLKPRYLPALSKAVKQRLSEVQSYGRT